MCITKFQRREGFFIKARRIFPVLLLLAVLVLVSSCISKDPAEETRIPVSVGKEDKEPQTPVPPQMDNTAPYYDTYNVSLDISPQNGTVSAIEKMIYKNTTGKDLDELYFNVYFNAFSEKCEYLPYTEETQSAIFPNGKEYAHFNINALTVNNTDVSYSLNNTVLTVKLREKLMQNEEAEIMLQFDSYIPPMSHRSGRNDKALWLGNFIPSIAVYDKSGWNKSYYYNIGEPFYSNISNYNVTVTTPQGYTVASTGTGTSTTTEQDGKKITTVSARMVRNFALSVSNAYLKKSIESNNGTTINLYYYTEDSKACDTLLELAKSAIEYYNNKVGSFPYQQLDMVEFQYFDESTLQFSKLTMIDEHLFKTPEKVDLFSMGFGLQWFSGIIGVNRITESWLCEGLTSFMQSYVFYSPEELDKAMKAEYAALTLDLKNEKHPELIATLAAYDSDTSYRNVQRRRSTLLFYSLYQKMGAEKFDTLLKMYYVKYSFKNVTAKEFMELSEEIYGESMSEFFQGWTKEAQMPPL